MGVARAPALVFKRTPAHDKFRDRLAALATDDAVLAAINESGPRCDLWPSGNEWGRAYERFNPDSEPFVTLVFESRNEPQVILSCEVFESRPIIKSLAQFCVDLGWIGWLRVSRFPFDPELTTLPKLVESLHDPDTKNRPTSPSVASVVRYRPLKRCTIRHQRAAGKAFFLKVFPDLRGEKIHATNLEFWRASEGGELKFKVARPAHWDSVTKSVWQEELRGTPATRTLFSDQGQLLAYRIGKALASITCSSVKLEERYGPEEQFRKSQRRSSELSAIVPSLGPAADQLIDKLNQFHRSAGEHQLKPIHGAPHRRQWLVDGERLSLVDLDRGSLGDPELDVAVFITNLEFENRSKIPVGKLIRELLSGYESVTGPLDNRLLNAYRAHGWLLKALRSSRAVRPDGDIRAKKNLSHALQCLEDDFV